MHKPTEISSVLISKPDFSSAEDQHLLSSWVDEHSDYLFHYARRYFRSTEKIEELVQDVFLAAVAGLARFERSASPRTWLTGILKHKIIDALRKKNREDPTDFSETDEGANPLFNQRGHWTVESGPSKWKLDPDAALANRQLGSALENCLQKLPEKLRQLFLLREVDGATREELSSDFSNFIFKCRSDASSR